MRTIALEEHCLTPGLRELLGPQIHPYYPVHRWPPALEARLRTSARDGSPRWTPHGIDMQVLSMVQPGLEHVTARACGAGGARVQRPRRRGGRRTPGPLRGLRRAADGRPGGGRRGARARGAASWAVGRDGQRPHAGALPRRRVLLADLRGRGGARGADLPAPDAPAARRSTTPTTRASATTSGSCSAPARGAGTSRPGCTRCG